MKKSRFLLTMAVVLLGSLCMLSAQKSEVEQFGSNSLYVNVYYPNTIDTSMYVIDKEVFDIKPSYPGSSTKMFRAFPIPSSDFIIIESDLDAALVLKYKVYNSEGVLLKEDKLTGTETLIHLEYDAKKAYLLKILSENQVLEAFSILKKN